MNTRQETLGEIFWRSPQEALEEKFRREAERLPYTRQKSIFIWTSQMGTHGKHRYGSYKDVRRKDLEGRTYEIEFMDGDIGIFWTDVLHDPETYKNVPKEVK
jgi:hypothetical protein